VGRRRDGERADAAGVVAGHGPRHRAAEVVADQVDLVRLEGVDDAEHVVDQMGHGVGGRVVGPGAGGVAALVDGDGPAALGGEGIQLRGPAA
jgi:hypothetical protein